jgi:dihydrofolate reductase
MRSECARPSRDHRTAPATCLRGPRVIRSIAALDDCLGLATETGIPWHVPADVEHFRATIASADVLMGYATYREFERPLPGSTNFVLARVGSEIRDGFVPVADVASALAPARAGELWIIGGAKVYRETLPSVEELYLTRVEGDFGCTKFFPPFESSFALAADIGFARVGDSPAYRFQTWRRRPRIPGLPSPV